MFSLDAQIGTEGTCELRHLCPPPALHLAHLSACWTWHRTTGPQLQPEAPDECKFDCVEVYETSNSGALDLLGRYWQTQGRS